MAVAVTLTMASRGLINWGSGTFSTRMSPGPYQQVAFTPYLLSQALHRPLRVRPHRLAFGGRHFACLQDLLEPPQIPLNLDRGRFAEQAGHGGAQPARGRGVVQVHVDLGPAPARCRSEH